MSTLEFVTGVAYTSISQIAGLQGKLFITSGPSSPGL